MQIQNRQSDKRSIRIGQQYRIMAGNRPNSVVNVINRIDFFKAILLIQGQSIDLIIDIDSPVTIIPPIINPLEIRRTTKCFVDVNKKPNQIQR